MQSSQFSARILGALVAAAVISTPLSMVHADMGIGVIGGVALAKLDFDPEQGVDFNSRPGLAIGAVLDFGIDDNVSLLVEPMFVQKGTKVEADGQDQGEFKVSYIEIPAMVKFGFGSGSTRPYVMAGPYLGVKVSAQAEDAAGNEEDLDEVVKSTDFGAGVGGGVDFDAGGNALFVDARYNVGFTNISDDPDLADLEVKNRVIAILAGIALPFGGGNGGDDYE